jgi:hypothetical protein
MRLPDLVRRDLGVSALLTGETRRDGQIIPEAEVERGSRTQSFQEREAKTVHGGPRRRGKRTAGGEVQVDNLYRSAILTGETRQDGRVIPEAEVERGSKTQSFQVREAGTVVLPPPHWAHLKGPQVPQAGTPVPQTPAPQEE